MKYKITPDLIILAGGKGSRLASVVSDVPKPLAPVLGRPFLDYILNDISQSGLFSSVTLALGHQAEKVIDHYQKNPSPIPLKFVIEKTPLGTGGGSRFALEHSFSRKQHTFILNGDSLVKIPFQAMLDFHLTQAKLGTLGLVHVSDCNRFGQVSLNGSFVESFLEKNPTSRPGLINAGVYLFQTEPFLEFASTYQEVCSIESELFPSLVGSQSLVGLEINSTFIDIGLPETYSHAGEFVKEFITQ